MNLGRGRAVRPGQSATAAPARSARLPVPMGKAPQHQFGQLKRRLVRQPQRAGDVVGMHEQFVAAQGHEAVRVGHAGRMSPARFRRGRLSHPCKDRRRVLEHRTRSAMVALASPLRTQRWTCVLRSARFVAWNSGALTIWSSVVRQLHSRPVAGTLQSRSTAGASVRWATCAASSSRLGSSFGIVTESDTDSMLEGR